MKNKETTVSEKEFIFPTKIECQFYCVKNNIKTKTDYLKHLEENPNCGLPKNPIEYYNFNS